MKTTPDARMREHFLGWQCRIRQHAMRHEGGRPSSGMRPRVLAPDGEVLSDGLTMLIVPEEPAEHTAFFRYQVQRTPDPRIVYEKGLAYLQSTFFQIPGDFSDEMTALLPPRSALAKVLLGLPEVVLDIEQFSQAYKMICTVRRLAAREPAHALTLWHNRLFNPSVPNASIVLAFQPRWASAQASPAP